MFTRLDDRRIRYAAFVLLMLSINLIDSIMTRSNMDQRRRMIVAAGASFDVVIVISALYYWMLVRPRIRTPRSLVPIALIGVVHTTYFYPGGVALRATIAGLCEAGLAGFVIMQVRRKTRSSDPSEAIGTILAGVFPSSFVARLQIAGELAVLY